MVLTPDPHLNLRADIKATLQSIDARIRAGGNWRGTARIARELADKLERLASMDDDTGPRVRYEERPEPPTTLNPTYGRKRKTRPPKKAHYEITELPPRELGPG